MRLVDNVVTRNDRYQIIILAIVVIFILLVIFALIFRNIDIGKKDNNTVGIVLSDGELTINYVDGQDIEIKDSKEHTYAITITNTSSKKIFYSLYFTDVENPDAYIVLEDYDGNEIIKVIDDLDTKRLVNLEAIKPEETIRYVVKVDGEESEGFKGKLLVVNESLSSDNFADLILATHSVEEARTRVGSEPSTIDEGLLETIDNKGKTYYFRGKINYNYVKLGSNMFRIVRVNRDGTVRLVLDGVLDEQYPYNSNGLTEGLTFSNLANIKNASILTVLNNWYETELKDYKKYIVNSNFCADETFNTVINDINYSNAYNRIFVDDTPDLFCSGSIYSGKVGLLSADEVALAGAYHNTVNDKYYLYNSDIKGSYVTLSSYSLVDIDLHMINVTNNGGFGNSVLISEKAYIRPVISIGANAKVKGDGTKENPYIIVA